MPRFTVTMAEGRIAKWLKKEGDAVEKGDAIFEVETEKITATAEALDSGVLRKIVARGGDVVPVGGLVALLASPGEELPDDFARGDLVP